MICILKGEMPFKMPKSIFLPEKNVCTYLPYKKFSGPLPETLTVYRVKPGKIGHQVNSDTYLQTV